MSYVAGQNAWHSQYILDIHSQALKHGADVDIPNNLGAGEAVGGVRQ